MLWREIEGRLEAAGFLPGLLDHSTGRLYEDLLEMVPYRRDVNANEGMLAGNAFTNVVSAI